MDLKSLSNKEILQLVKTLFDGENALSVDLPPEIYEFISDVGELRMVRSQQVVVDCGMQCSECFLVIDGAFVCQYFEEESLVERTVNFHTAYFHPFMTSVESYFFNKKSKYKLKAVRPSKVLVLKRPVVAELYKSAPLIYQLYFSLLTTSLSDEITLRSKLLSLPAEKLYAYLVKFHPQLIYNIPSKYIAEFMGISQEWLSKLKKSNKIDWF
ncbi:Crp/Fnr family transcriptional regulator [Marinifilum sp. D737]|uniref:Crp/Fnr family transcriptional regulator n=1 Tax=Marinifilum sp. D737 TaxID=2969628 RepID=UPI0022740E6A|nr:hypothetical protein [Marinifilum sp. D737]MCY1636024.1 hypothetical protein [Marinifilum sp. D737]